MGRWCVTITSSPDRGIAPRDRDPEVWGQCSLSQLRDRSKYILFLHTLIWVRGTSGVGQMCRDRESGILVILLMVNLRVVDILGVV